MRNTLLAILFSFEWIICLGQNAYPTRDSVHIFWQPGLVITYLDYKGAVSNKEAKDMDKYGYSAAAFVGIWNVLDVAKKDDRFEKAYFAPAFDRTTSSTRTSDTLQIAMQNLYFDICEIWARWARRELKEIKDTMNAIGAQAIMYTTIVQDMEKNRLEMYSSYAREVFILKKEGSYERWRNLINRILDETKEWTTTPEECYRFIKGKPIEKGYVKAKYLIGPMPDRENNNR